jgi:iron complex transport system substrate-binding protein
MEQFYAEAKDADVILYNGTIGGEVSSLEELLEKNELLRQFKAVQTGQVWCTQKNLYQESLALGTVIADIHTVLTDPHGEAPLTFLYPLT